MMIDFFSDGLFSAIAAIGFSAISRPPKRIFLYCAVVAAIGHAGRYALMHVAGMHILAATFVASVVLGTVAVMLSPLYKAPAETCIFPALLPMIPGIYAYKAFGGLAMCLLNGVPDTFDFYFYQFAFNGFTCVGILMCLVIGGTIPIFVFKKISFQATR